MIDNAFKKYPIILVLLIATAQTFASVIPGMLTVSNSKNNLPSYIVPLIIYCLLANTFQFFTVRGLKRNVNLSLPLFIGKFIISLIFIVLIGFLGNFFFSIVLLTYEIFQLTLFWKSFHLFDTIFFPLLNSFYNGLVFNFIVSITFPYHFTFSLIEAYIFSFLLFLLVSIFVQAVSLEQNKEMYLTLVLVVFVLSIIFLIYSFIASKLSFLKLAILIIANIPLFIWFFHTRVARKKELILYVFLIINFFIFYK